MKVIDLTHTIRADMPVYPGTEPPILAPANTYERDGFKETRLTLFTHTGTHADPPAHLFPGRTTLDQFPAEQFIGKALVIDCRDLEPGEAITLDHLRRYGGLVEQADFLLFHLGWDRFWGTDDYFGDYPCLDDEVLDAILRGHYKGIGFDVIGLDPIADENLTRHKKLFRDTDILNLENLKNLDQCGEGLFWFSCFPLKRRTATAPRCGRWPGSNDGKNKAWPFGHALFVPNMFQSFSPPGSLSSSAMVRLNWMEKMVAVVHTARKSATGSARNTAKTLSAKKWGRI